MNPAAARLNESVGADYRCGVTEYVYFAQSRGCAIALPGGDAQDADIVLFGNSHAQMYGPLVGRIAAAAEQRALLVSMKRCTPTLGPNERDGCRTLAQRHLEAIASLPRARIVVLATTWDNEGDPQAFIDGLDAAIALLTGAGKRVLLVGPIATPDWHVASIASRSLAFGHPLDRPLAQDRAAFEAQFAGALRHFSDRPDVDLLLPHELQCDELRCPYVVDGRVLFSDGTHLVERELERFRPAFEPALRRAIAATRAGE